MKPHFLFLVSLLAACKGPTPVPTDVPPVTVPPVTEPPGPTVCSTWEQALIDNDLQAARTAFEACLVDDPTDAMAMFGRGLTGLGLVYDSAPVRQLLTTCNESPDLYEPLFGASGLLQTYTDGMAGTATLTTADLVVDGTTTALGLLDSIEFVMTEPGPQVNIADTHRQQEGIEIDLSGVGGLTVGQTIDVATDGAWVSVFMPCSLNPEHCTGDFQPDSITGTIIVNDLPAAGGTLDLSFDVNVPRFCSSCTSSTVHLVGTVTDTVTDLEALAYDLPFVEAVDASACLNGSDCDDRTETLSVLADICPAGTADLAWGQARLLGDLFSSFAADFEAAGANADFAFAFPNESVFFLDHDLDFNQTDALGLASLVQMMSASIVLSTNYDVLEPTATLGSRNVAYTGGWGWYDDIEATCETDHAYWGISVASLVDELDTYGGAVRSDTDFAKARAEMLAGLENLRAAGAASPTADGFFDFSQTSVYIDSVTSDLDVVIASLQGTDGPLATAPIYQVTLDAFFADPPDRSDVLTETGLSNLVVVGIDENACESTIEEQDTGSWIQESNRAFPVTQAIIDAETLPAWMEQDMIDAILDLDDVPLFIDNTIDVLIEDNTYAQ